MPAVCPIKVAGVTFYFFSSLMRAGKISLDAKLVTIGFFDVFYKAKLGQICPKFSAFH